MAGAMRALLPAVDANDEAKTLAVLRFFCVVLSSVPRLEVRPDSDTTLSASWLESINDMACTLLFPGILALRQSCSP